jgi:hypothetical protein
LLLRSCASLTGSIFLQGETQPEIQPPSSLPGQITIAGARMAGHGKPACAVAPWLHVRNDGRRPVFVRTGVGVRGSGRSMISARMRTRPERAGPGRGLTGRELSGMAASCACLRAYVCLCARVRARARVDACGRVRTSVCVRVRACARACVRVRVIARMRACARCFTRTHARALLRAHCTCALFASASEKATVPACGRPHSAPSSVYLTEFTELRDRVA